MDAPRDATSPPGRSGRRARAIGPGELGRWRDALRSARWTVDAVAEQLGVPASAALRRNETVPALRATRDGSALSTLTRLWTLQVPVPLEDAERALPGLVDPLCVAGVLQRSVGEVAALVDVRPYADEEHDWWVVADLTPGVGERPRRVRPDHVLGVSDASSSLAQLVVRDPVERALDVGTGSGVQALHLSTHARRVVGTDVNPRALALADLTAGLNGVSLELRTGSLFEPVAGEEYDLVVTNPPFVISPATGERLVYRDSGLPGDRVVEHLVRAAPAHLAPNGRCQILANWAHVAGQPWQARVGSWLVGSGCDAWVLQRDIADLPAYVEMWLADAGLQQAPDYAERYDTWLSWFEEQGIEGVGFGWLCLQRTDRVEPVVRCEEWPHEVTQPLGPAVAGWSRRVEALSRLDDRDLLATLLRRPDLVVQEQLGQPGAADPDRVVLRLGQGVRRARQVGTVEAALVGACDGDLAVGQILAAVADLLGAELTDLTERTLPLVRTLVEEGFLEPPE